MYMERFIFSAMMQCGNIIDLNNGSIYLDKKETKTTPEFYVSKSSHPNFDHYEIVYSGYYTTK